MLKVKLVMYHVKCGDSQFGDQRFLVIKMKYMSGKVTDTTSITKVRLAITLNNERTTHYFRPTRIRVRFDPRVADVPALNTSPLVV
jgi:hypothetical protein